MKPEQCFCKCSYLRQLAQNLHILYWFGAGSGKANGASPHLRQDLRALRRTTGMMQEAKVWPLLKFHGVLRRLAHDQPW